MAIGDIPSSYVDGSVTATDDNSNSATLTRASGDFSFSGMSQNGREIEKSESRGVTIGLRLTARKHPQVTVTRVLATPNDAWNLIVNGLTSGFTSVTADIGDVKSVDLDFNFDYGADVRDVVMTDCHLTDYSLDESGGTESYTFECIGPVSIDSQIFISSR